ncbi:competence protein CoiA family protein [Ochrobactrum sp. RH2CCR150]|uniref:competence protein CoiA family protein n=1 Tax=Ochrobactrum sp. RH2CCR150 TaxID=2587044 RepID=UPI0015F7D465|nr:hypothetical protein [Ochrobactrum sp. RH2CCR150]
MLLAWTGAQKRRPLIKGEWTICRDCGGELIAVLPIQNVAHWRHKQGDCDPWSEPEGEWHLRWKSFFSLDECEVTLSDDHTGERHRADILCNGHHYRTIVELQHSSISEEERGARETFYGRKHRMFWLLDLADESSFREINFGMSLDFKSRPVECSGRQFHIMRWVGRSSQWIEKWKRSGEHVFLSYRNTVMYLATSRSCSSIMPMMKKGEFAVSLLSEQQFLAAVRA